MSTADDPVCRNCRVSMEKGWVLDRAHAGEMHLSKWTKGEARPKKFLWFQLRSVQCDHDAAVPVASWRCPRCGLLESYAR